jgi:hypothetical protein
MYDVLHDTLDSLTFAEYFCPDVFCFILFLCEFQNSRISRLDQVVPTVLDSAPGVLVPLRRRPFGQWGDTRPFATRVLPCPSRLAQRWVNQVASGSLIFAVFFNLNYPNSRRCSCTQRASSMIVSSMPWLHFLQDLLFLPSTLVAICVVRGTKSRIKERCAHENGSIWRRTRCSHSVPLSKNK